LGRSPTGPSRDKGAMIPRLKRTIFCLLTVRLEIERHLVAGIKGVLEKISKKPRLMTVRKGSRGLGKVMVHKHARTLSDHWAKKMYRWPEGGKMSADVLGGGRHRQ